MVFALSNVVSTKHQLLQRWRSLYQRLRQIHSIKELITNAFASRPHMVSARQRLLSVVSWIQLVGHSSLLELSNLSCWLGDFQIVKGLWFCLLCKFTIIASLWNTQKTRDCRVRNKGLHYSRANNRSLILASVPLEPAPTPTGSTWRHPCERQA